MATNIRELTGTSTVGFSRAEREGLLRQLKAAKRDAPESEQAELDRVIEKLQREIADD